MNTKIGKALRVGALVVASVFALYSCTDKWDDHYETVQEEVFKGTLMECLESQGDKLSDFVEVLKAVGYDVNLNSDQMFTVWAPVNGSFDKDALLASIQNGDKERVLKRFVRNHIALYNISLTPNEQEVTLQNAKIIRLSGAAESKFGDCDILTPNIVCTNGVLNLIASENIYVPTIFESLEDEYNEYLSANPDVDPKTFISMMSYLKAYDDDSLDESKSTFKGLDMSGNRVYIDSVMIRNNTILRMLDALIYEDDSTYWTIVPSIEAYQQRYEEAKKYLAFNPSENSEKDPDLTDSLQHRYANLFAMRDLFYNVNANEHYTDSLKSTDYSRLNWKEHVYRGDPFGADGILSSSEVVECSNGNIYKVDEYPVSIYDQFFKEISVTLGDYLVDYTEKDGKLENTKNCTTNPVPSRSGSILWLDDKTYSYSALNIIPSSNLVQPQVTFKISGTLSGKYDLKIVTIPIAVKNGIFTFEDDKLYKFRVNLFQRNDEGEYPRATTLYKPGTKTRDFESRPMKELTTPFDTIDICDIDLTRSYYGRPNGGVMVQIVTNVSATNLKNGYSREMLLHKVLLVPHREENVESGE